MDFMQSVTMVYWYIGVSYSWRRRKLTDDEKSLPLFPDTTPHIFVSANGKLYFTEVTKADEADYYCQVTLCGAEGKILRSAPPPNSTSQPISLRVTNQGKYIP